MNAQPPAPRGVPIGASWPDMEVAGESYHRDAVAKVFAQLHRGEGGVSMQTAWLFPEPGNKYDPNAVKVVIRGEHVGYVPAESSPAVAQLCRSLGPGNMAIAPAMVWATNADGTWRSRVTLTFSGTTETEKDYAAATALDAAARTLDAAGRAREVASRTAGTVDGQYWPLFKSTISELKRQKRFDEAENLLEKCVYAAEREATVTGREPDPWPSEQMSVVMRVRRNYSRELFFLERYVTACGENAVPDSVLARLNRARVMVGPTGASSTPAVPQ